MKEYQELIEEYASEAYLSFNHIVPVSEWGNKEVAEKYLEKYWLPKDEYESIWKPIQDQIFINQDKGLPELVFSEQHEILALRGGCLFLKEDFKQLRDCFLSIGNQNFVIVENIFGGKLKEVPFRMKYSTQITWEELIGGNFVSSALIDNSAKEYFVFSESSTWGKYAANDAEKPLDILGFKPEYAPLFKEKFKLSEEEWEEIKEWLPPKYKEIIK